MTTITSKINWLQKVLYIVLALACLLPFVTPPYALFAGLAFALLWGQPFPTFNKKASKYLLQVSVVGLGFGMNVHSAIASGKEGMLLTIVSVVTTMLIGSWLAHKLRVDKKTGYLISTGTAICGGSAIAAVGPVLKADDGQLSVSLATIFMLNAIALFIFPVIGHLLGLNQQQFGVWSAIAIHDTSSVVGAAASYGTEALKIATTVKLTRALWIIPMIFVTSMIFRNKSGKKAYPWFILFFIVAMLTNTYLKLPVGVTETLVLLAKKGLTLTLFFIGASLSKQQIRVVGYRPVVQGVLLWIFIATSSLLFILLG